MMKRFVAILLVFLFVESALFAEEGFYANPKIIKISYKGLINAKKTDFEDLIPIKIGDDINERLLNQAMKTLYSLDMFKDVQIDIDEVKDGISLTFSFAENPYIQSVRFVSNTSVNADDLKKIIEVSEGSYYTESKIVRDIEAIEKKFENEGFMEVKVSNTLTRNATNKNAYDLTYFVTEGGKIVVEKIEIIGAKNIPVGDIKNVMKTKERIFIIQQGILKPDEFEDDKKNVVLLYQHKGMLDVKLKRFEWKVERFDQDKHKGIAVYIDIEEGPVYYAGKLAISGNEIYSTNDLYPLVEIKEGDVYDKMKVEMARMAIYNKYSDGGRLYANVSLLEDKFVTNITNINYNMVNMSMEIFEGPIAHIEKITIRGNTKTLTNVIMRELMINEGELYIQRKVRQSYEKLVSLQYFADIRPTFNPGSADGLINLDIEVEEQRTGLVTFGLGYGTESGFNASGSVSEKNFFGTGRILSARLEIGQTRQLLELSYQEPWLFDDPTFLGFSIALSSYLYENIPTDDNFDGIIDMTNINYIDNPNQSIANYLNTNSHYYKQNFGLGVSVSRRFFNYWLGYLSLGASIYRDTDASFTNPLLLTTSGWVVDTDLKDSLAKGANGFTWKNSFGFGASVNTAFDPINPLSGVTFNLDMLYVGGIMQGDINYIKPKLSFNYYWNPVWKLVFAFHASTEMLLPQFGYSNAVYTTSDMLWFDGVYEMRGWQNYPARGEAKAFYSTEFRFPIYGAELWGLTFFDIGALWDKAHNWSFDPKGYLFSFGLGIKINIPMLPIRLYYARKGYYDSVNQSWRLQADSAGNEDFFANWQLVFSIQGLF